MKTALPLPASRLGLGLLGLLSAFALPPALATTPVPITTARTAFVQKDFTAMKAALDPFIATGVINDEARVLRAIALAGIAAETRVPAYLRSIGAKVARLDISADAYDYDFPQAFTYQTTPAFTVSGSSYAASNLYPPASPRSITFVNNGSAAYTLSLKFVVAPDVNSNRFLNAQVDIDGEESAYLNSGATFSNYIFDSLLKFTVSSASQGTLIAKINSGHSLTITLDHASKVTITPTAALPSTVVALNGKRVADSRDKLATAANADGLLAFLKTLDDSVLAPIITDLTAFRTTAKVTLTPTQTGHPTSLIVAYPDVRLVLAILKFNQALRLLNTSYNLSLDFKSGALFDADALDTLVATPAFLASRPTSPAADRTLTRSLFNAALTHYFQADTAGLWSRPAPTTGSYLLQINAEDRGERTSFNNSLKDFRTSLNTPVLLSKLNPESTSELAPTQLGVSLAPLFASTPLSLRTLVPKFTDFGFVRGSSTPLLKSGLLANASTAWWEDVLNQGGLTDLAATAVRTAANIRTQPTIASAKAGASTPPTLLTGAATAGNFVVLEVVALGYPLPTYQWRKNGRTITGATKDYLSFDSVKTTDAGKYDVIVKNTVGTGGTTVISLPVTLSVSPAP